MINRKERLQDFVLWWKTYCHGDEKGEAQIFIDRLFRAFGHPGVLEVGGTPEFRIHKKDHISFADFVWRPKLLLEMKKRATVLSKHYNQVFEYWLHLVPSRPQYVILCNFDEFWIYDFNRQLEEPIDIVKIVSLPDNWGPLAFLFPGDEQPIFGNDLVEVTANAADKVAKMFRSLMQRGLERVIVQRFTLQCVLAMFSEDIELLPRYIFTRLVDDCLNGANSYDLLGELFSKMNEPGLVPYGRYKGVNYFNGGLFKQIYPIELTKDELIFLKDACSFNWSKVKPAIFGTLFEQSMDGEERHVLGAHFTSEADIQKIVLPTIIRPWRERINETNSIKELLQLTYELWNFKVLDPACGSGNFLYVAYRELKRIEYAINSKIADIRRSNKNKYIEPMGISFVTTKQFFGFDMNDFAVELAKVTMMIAKKLALDELHMDENALPLDDLNENIVCTDALFNAWPEVDAIIGNPPFQSKNKMQQEFGIEYLHRLRKEFKRVPGRADYCVYWFRKAHEVMKSNARAGLVGTNTIRQNYSREGGLDYIVNNGGTIIEAVSTQPWSGDAVVHVSIVNWIKGSETRDKLLFIEKDGHIERNVLKVIPSGLSKEFDVTQACSLKCNEGCHQGQTHGHESFLLTPEHYLEIINKDPKSAEVIFPFLTANELIGKQNGKFSRFVIDFHPKTIIEAKSYNNVFAIVQHGVLPDRLTKAQQQEVMNKQALLKTPGAKVNHHHINFLKYWWLLSYPRPELIKEISLLTRYIVCSQVTKRPVFEFVESKIRPNASLIVFTFEDDYSFGILQSILHWTWFMARCLTLKEDNRYTSQTVYSTFPWPQQPSEEQIEKVATLAKKLRNFRTKIMRENGLTFRELYRSLELPGKNELSCLHVELDKAVFQAYNFEKGNILNQLFDLNQVVFGREQNGEQVTKPGLPLYIKEKNKYISSDCISAF